MSSPEQTTLKKIARRYWAEGYDVIISPSVSERPESLRDFVIDLLAKRENEFVIVEVKKSTSEKPDPRLRALAEAVSRLPNYRLDFVAAGKTSQPGRKDWLGTEELRNRIDEAVRLFGMGFSEASILLLWSATEGALRLLSDRQHVSARSESPLVMVKTLYAQGVLDKSQYNLLEQAVQYRNAATHGYRTERITEAFVQRWRELTTSLLART